MHYYRPRGSVGARLAGRGCGLLGRCSRGGPEMARQGGGPREGGLCMGEGLQEGVVPEESR